MQAKAAERGKRRECSPNDEGSHSSEKKHQQDMYKVMDGSALMALGQFFLFVVFVF